MIEIKVNIKTDVEKLEVVKNHLLDIFNSKSNMMIGIKDDIEQETDSKLIVSSTVSNSFELKDVLSQFSEERGNTSDTQLKSITEFYNTQLENLDEEEHLIGFSIFSDRIRIYIKNTETFQIEENDLIIE